MSLADADAGEPARSPAQRRRRLARHLRGLFSMQLLGDGKGLDEKWRFRLAWRGWFGWMGGQVSNYKYFSDDEIKGLDLELCAMLDRARGLAGLPFIITCG